MISTLTLRNFKGFGDDPQRIQLAPLTLVYGPNSAGKSSIIQSLLLLKQSYLHANRRGTDGLVTHGELVDVGNFSNVIHRHRVSRTLGIEVETRRTVDPRPSNDFIDFLQFDRTAVGLGFTARSGGVGGAADGAHIETTLSVLDEPALVMRRIDEGSQSVFAPKRGSQRDIVNFALRYYPVALERWNSRPYLKIRRMRARSSEVDIALDPSKSQALKVLHRWLREPGGEARAGEGPRLRSSGGYFPDARPFLPFVLRPTTDSLLNQCMFDYFRAPASDFEHSMERVRHVGPVRLQPSRAFSRPLVTPTHVGRSGEDAEAVLTADSAALRQTNKWLRELDVPYRVQPEAFETPSALAMPILGGMAALLLVDSRLGVAVSTRDVGFGVSQIIPVLTQLAMDKKQIVCIEQPEIHLHPRLQAGLADVFIEGTGVGARADRSTQVIAETHSEALMLRLQRRIREGACDPDRISVIYVDHVPGRGSVASRLRMNSSGEFIDPWPHGFFDDSLADLFAGM